MQKHIFSDDYSIVAIGGENSDGQALNNVTVISLGPVKNHCKLPVLPFTLSEAGSVVLSDGSIMICGGKRNYNSDSTCNTLTNKGWTETYKMVSIRYMFYPDMIAHFLEIKSHIFY